MEWRLVFWIAFIIFMVTNLVYVLWASGETQPWNNLNTINKKEDTESASDNKLKELNL